MSTRQGLTSPSQRDACTLCQFRTQTSRSQTVGLGTKSIYTLSNTPRRAASTATSSTQTTTETSETPVTDAPDITNHYTIFPKTLPAGPPPASPFEISLGDLRREFLQLQGLVHPDKYPSGSAKQQAEALSARINEAYRTLSDPLQRAQYLLREMHGIDVTAEDASTKHALDANTLMEVMEVQETIEEVGASPEAEAEIDALKDENEMRIKGIIHSPSFTFLVGPKHTKLTIQSGLAQHVSKPLHNLMNNGHTRESRHRIAVLEDEDVETFVAFCEYAYTGDYKVPRLPVPAPLPTPAAAPALSTREDIRTRAVESVTSPGPSWRGTYRSDSVSSAVPPPAPSPPPESETGAQTVKGEEEVPPVYEEDAPAEAQAEAEASPETEAVAEEAAEPEVQEPPADEARPPSETGETTEPAEPVEPVDKHSTTNWAQYEVSEEAPASTEEQVALETTEPADSPAREPSTTVTNRKKMKDKKKKHKKSKNYTVPLEEEPPASLTPPSTPPPQEPEVAEKQCEPELEPAAAAAPEPEPEPEPAECEDGALVETEEAEAEAVGEPPVEEPPASFLPSPAPSPSTVPYDGTEWPQPDCPPQQDNADAKDEDDTPGPKNSTSWDDYPTASQTIQEPSSPKPIIDMSFAKQQSDSAPRKPGLSLWDEFTALQYNDDSAEPSTSKQPINSSLTATTMELPYLTFHAKVYVFATRYLIPALAQLCLRKLHTDLVHLPLGDGNIEEAQAQDYAEADTDADAEAGTTAHPAMQTGLPGAPAIVLDVLRYAYTKTTRLEPINPTSATQLRENELRRLVVHYAACRIKELARWHGGGSGSATPAVRGVGVGVDGMKVDSLRALLDGTPELASDLVYRMM
ncbi:J-type co-chaperone JAC1 [Penicillium rolfsii]|nr:J-type co-chaperone JAC1 [Penicillium rolfsii]